MLFNTQSQPHKGGRVHILSLFLLSSILVLVPFEAKTLGETPAKDEDTSNFHIIQENSIKTIPSPSTKTDVSHEINVLVTGYSSTPEQTDSTPFITASGKRVRGGIVATNLLPFGTKIRIPEIYGDKIFVVEDRMHARNSMNVDIWFPTYEQAKNFGVAKAHIEVLN